MYKHLCRRCLQRVINVYIHECANTHACIHKANYPYPHFCPHLLHRMCLIVMWECWWVLELASLPLPPFSSPSTTNSLTRTPKSASRRSTSTGSAPSQLPLNGLQTSCSPWRNRWRRKESGEIIVGMYMCVALANQSG